MNGRTRLKVPSGTESCYTAKLCLLPSSCPPARRPGSRFLPSTFTFPHSFFDDPDGAQSSSPSLPSSSSSSTWYICGFDFLLRIVVTPFASSSRGGRGDEERAREDDDDIGFEEGPASESGFAPDGATDVRFLRNSGTSSGLRIFVFSFGSA